LVLAGSVEHAECREPLDDPAKPARAKLFFGLALLTKEFNFMMIIARKSKKKSIFSFIL
jgi:hypothetical protein